MELIPCGWVESFEEQGLRIRKTPRQRERRRESKPMTFLAECDLSGIYHWHKKIHHENPFAVATNTSVQVEARHSSRAVILFPLFRGFELFVANL